MAGQVFDRPFKEEKKGYEDSFKIRLYS